MSRTPSRKARFSVERQRSAAAFLDVQGEPGFTEAAVEEKPLELAGGLGLGCVGRSDECRVDLAGVIPERIGAGFRQDLVDFGNGPASLADVLRHRPVRNRLRQPSRSGRRGASRIARPG